MNPVLRVGGALALLGGLLLFGCAPLFPIPDHEGDATSSAANLDVLVVVYTSGGSGIDSTELASLKEGLELARLFYWRNSLGRLNLNLQYLEVSDYTPDEFWPPNLIEQDLRSRGIGDNDYDAVYVVSNVPDMGCWADGTILGKTAIAVGRVCGVPYPGDDPGIDYTMTWCFTHEFQHNLDGVFAGESGHPEMLHGHLEDAFAAKPAWETYDAGTHYDWQAFLLRKFAAYDDFSAPWDGRITFADADRDGLPDDDERLPMDESRLGSSTARSDTDGDGSSDLEEFAAGIFTSSDPQDPDTDGDGLTDGSDPYPLYGFAREIQGATPAIDGVLDSEKWTLLREGWFFSDDGSFDSTVYAAWDDDYLYFAARTSEPVRLFIRIDGSGESGMFEGGDTYEVCVDPASSTPKAVGAELSPHGGAQAFAATLSGVVSSRREGRTYVLEAAVPRQLGPGFGFVGPAAAGLTLAEGSALGLDIVLQETRSAGNPSDRFSGQKAYLSEPHTYVDVVLRESGEPEPTGCLVESFAQDRHMWNVLDPSGRIGVMYGNEGRLTFDHWVRPEPGYVATSFDVSDFRMQFDIHITESGGNAKVVGPGVASNLATVDQADDGVYVAYYAGFPTVSPRLYLVTFIDGEVEWGWGGNPPHANSIDISQDAVYYVTVVREGTTIALSVYADSERTQHVAGSPKVITSGLTGTPFHYVYAITGDTTPPEGNWEWTSGWVDNLLLCPIP